MDCRPLIVAHRGYAPHPVKQNSLEAFRLAERYGAEAIELDVRMTEDHELVVFHDPFIWTGKRFRRIPFITLDEFRQYVAPNRAPLLNTVFQELKREIKFFIELKPTPYTEILIQRLQEILPDDRETIVLTYKQHILKQLHQTNFQSGLHYVNPLKDNIARAIKYGATVLSPLYWLVSPKSVQKIQQAKLQVYPWTVNKPRFIKNLIRWGVDGIYTNNFVEAKTLANMYGISRKKMIEYGSIYNLP